MPLFRHPDKLRIPGLAPSIPLAGLLAIVMICGTTLPAAEAIVAPPQSKPYGLSNGEWSAKWWQWALSANASESPLVDPTGANCGEGQSGRVWFLAGALGPGEPIVRNCEVPVGKALFFPVANAFCVGEGDGSFAAQRTCAAGFLEPVTAVSLEIDGDLVDLAVADPGEPVASSRYRALSPPFDLILSADNVFGAPAGVYEPVASDGIHVMVRPLRAGAHTVHIRAEFGLEAIDVTYELMVR